MSAKIRVMLGALLVIIVLFSLCPCCSANDFARSLSDNIKPAIAASAAAMYFTADDHKMAKATRLLDAAVCASGVAEYLKPILKVNSNGRFPSGHSAGAFAAAACLAEEHPKQKWLYYTAAGLVAWSRVELGAHEWEDVIAGAALGIAIGKWSIRSDNGIMIGRAFEF